jgi:hypothetical protein
VGVPSISEDVGSVIGVVFEVQSSIIVSQFADVQLRVIELPPNAG